MNALRTSDFVGTLRARRGLAGEQAEAVCELLFDAELSVEESAEILVLLADKGETPEELHGFARVLLRHAEHVPFDDVAVDTCGTGGSGLVRFNTSTAVQLRSVAAHCRSGPFAHRWPRLARELLRSGLVRAKFEQYKRAAQRLA